jgi:hypothetical protein
MRGCLHSSIALRPAAVTLDPYNLDRLAASHHHLALCCCKPAPDETGEHPAAEAMAADKQLLVGAMAAAGEQL